MFLRLLTRAPRTVIASSDIVKNRPRVHRQEYGRLRNLKSYREICGTRNVAFLGYAVCVRKVFDLPEQAWSFRGLRPVRSPYFFGAAGRSKTFRTSSGIAALLLLLLLPLRLLLLLPSAPAVCPCLLPSAHCRLAHTSYPGPTRNRLNDRQVDSQENRDHNAAHHHQNRRLKCGRQLLQPDF